MPDIAGAITLDSLSAEDQAAIDALAEGVVAEDPTEEPDPRTPVTTAFVLYQTLDGQIIAQGDLSVIDKIRTIRPAGIDDMYALGSVLLKDITTSESAQQVLGLMQQQAQAMQQAQEAAAVRSRLKL